jgi:hypothetical protein
MSRRGEIIYYYPEKKKPLLKLSAVAGLLVGAYLGLPKIGVDTYAFTRQIAGQTRTFDEGNTFGINASFEPVLSPESIEKFVDSKANYLLGVYNTQLDQSFGSPYSSEESKKEFFKEVTQMAIRLNPQNPLLANQIVSVMNFESGLSPSIQNPNSTATGLIQFMDFTANEIGTSTYALAQMTPVEQLKFVEEYFARRQQQTGTKLSNIYDVYMSVLWPAAMGQDPSTAIMSQGDGNYEVNSGLDLNNDGQITIQEAANMVIQRAIGAGERTEYLGIK